MFTDDSAANPDMTTQEFSNSGQMKPAVTAGDSSRSASLFLRGGEVVLVPQGARLRLHSLRERRPLGVITESTAPIVAVFPLRSEGKEARGHLAPKSFSTKGEDNFCVGVVDTSGYLTTVDFTRRVQDKEPVWSWEAREPFRLQIPSNTHVLHCCQAGASLNTFALVTMTKCEIPGTL